MGRLDGLGALGGRLLEGTVLVQLVKIEDGRGIDACKLRTNLLDVAPTI